MACTPLGGTDHNSWGGPDPLLYGVADTKAWVKDMVRSGAAFQMTFSVTSIFPRVAFE